MIFHSSLEFGMFFRISYLFIIILLLAASTNAFRDTFNIGVNWVTKAGLPEIVLFKGSGHK